MAKYCSNCGKKLSDNDKFCVNCGEKVVQNNDSIETNIKVVEQQPELNGSSKDRTLFSDVPPKKNKSKILLKWIIGIFISFIGLYIVGLIIQEPYPKNSEEMATLLTNKCWKPKKFEIKSISINGEYIPNPNADDVREKLKKAVNVANGTDNSYIWENFQMVLDEETKDNYSFIRFTKHSDGKFLYYTQSFDKDKQSPTYNFLDSSCKCNFEGRIG